MENKFKVEAFCYGIDPRPDWFNDKVTLNEIVTYIGTDNNDKNYYRCLIKLKDGNKIAQYGDYIIRGTNGEVHAISSELFHLTYETKIKAIIKESFPDIENCVSVSASGKWVDMNKIWKKVIKILKQG